MGSEHYTDGQVLSLVMEEDNAAASTTQKGIVVAGEYNSTAPTYTSGDITVLQTDANGYLHVVTESDIQIGAIEIKNADTEDRASITDANTARTTATHVLAVQNIDAEGHVPDWSDLDDIRVATEKIDDLQGALKSVDTDELITRITDSAGAEINPAKEDGNLATIAGDTTSLDTKEGTTGEAADVDGTRAGQLRYIGEANESSRALLATIDADTSTIAGDTTSIDGKITACNTGAVVVSSGAITETNSGDIKTAVEKIDDLQGALKSVDTDELISRITDSAGTEINPAKEDGNLATIAGDTTSLDTKEGTTGEAAAVDGTRAAQLRYAGSKIEDARALLATIDADTSTLQTSGGGGYIRQDSTATIAKETGGNLASVKTNTDPLGSGATPFFDSDGDNSAQALKAGAGVLYKLHVINSNSADAYVQLFNVAAGSVTVGSTTPNYVVFVPSEGAVIEDFGIGLAFGTAITYACTTTATGNGDPTTGLTVSAGYI